MKLNIFIGLPDPQLYHNETITLIEMTSLLTIINLKLEKEKKTSLFTIESTYSAFKKLQQMPVYGVALINPLLAAPSINISSVHRWDYQWPNPKVNLESLLSSSDIPIFQ